MIDHNLQYKENTLKTFELASLASGDEMPAGYLDPEIVRTAGVTLRATYGVVTDSTTLRLNVYYSPDGQNYDTVAYTYFDLDLSTGTTQKTVILDLIEHGWYLIKVQNNTPDAATNVKVWVSNARWGDHYLEATKTAKMLGSLDQMSNALVSIDKKLNAIAAMARRG